MRTTLDIDDPILRRIKELAARENTSLARLANELLATALAHRDDQERQAPPFLWQSGAMKAQVNLEDKELLMSCLDDDG